MSVESFVLVLETPNGEQVQWKTIAETGCKALLAATELLPDHEILKVLRECDWE